MKLVSLIMQTKHKIIAKSLAHYIREKKKLWTPVRHATKRREKTAKKTVCQRTRASKLSLSGTCFQAKTSLRLGLLARESKEGRVPLASFSALWYDSWEKYSILVSDSLLLLACLF